MEPYGEYATRMKGITHPEIHNKIFNDMLLKRLGNDGKPLVRYLEGMVGDARFGYFHVNELKKTFAKMANEERFNAVDKRQFRVWSNQLGLLPRDFHTKLEKSIPERTARLRMAKTLPGASRSYQRVRTIRARA